jgi:hypothetical protein
MREPNLPGSPEKLPGQLIHLLIRNPSKTALRSGEDRTDRTEETGSLTENSEGKDGRGEGASPPLKAFFMLA